MTTPFLDWLREAAPAEGRGNDEILRAMLPLLRQVIGVHEQGRVAPLDGVGRLFFGQGALYFHADDALAPRQDGRALTVRRATGGGGVEVVANSEVLLDFDRGLHASISADVQDPGKPIARPVFVRGYTTWEQEVGHHDALTDVFSLGMLMASLALGLDFTEADELLQFVHRRHELLTLRPTLHPVIARAIVRMTETDRHRRAQDLRSLADRLDRYREVDDRADRDVDFRRIEGFVQADRSSRRKLVQAHLQGRLFDVSKRNRLIYFKPTQQMLDLTIASVPLQLSVEAIRPEELFLWDGRGGQDVVAQRPLDLGRYVRFEEAPWVRGVLDHIRGEEARQRAEIGFSELKLVVAFLNWHDIKDKGAADERIRSPLLLLPVTLDRKRGVRDSYVLQATTSVAEVNPVLRHHLHELFAVELPEQVDLEQTDVATFHAAIRAELTRSEPGLAVHLVTRPQIRLATERARRRLDAWRRRSSASGAGLHRHDEVDFSYSPGHFQPLGLQLFQRLVKPEELAVEQHIESAHVVVRPPPLEDERPQDDEGGAVVETARPVYAHTEEAAGRMDWAVDFTHCTLGNFSYRKTSLVRDYAKMLEEPDGEEHPAFDALFSPDAREIETPPAPGGDPFDTFSVVPADPTQTAAIRWARTGRDFIIQGPPGTGKSQTITNLIADFAARGKRVLFVCQKRAALDVVYHRLAEHGLDELSVIIHDSQADKKPFIDDLRSTYEAWSQPQEARPGGTAEQRRQAVLGRLRETVEALDRFRSGMKGPVADGDATVADVLTERLAAPLDVDVPVEALPTHREWKRNRDAVLAAGRALSDAGREPIVARLPLRWVGRAVLEAAQPVGALRSGLDRLDGFVERARSASALLGPDATADDLREALDLATELTPLIDRAQLALLDRSSGPSSMLQGFVARVASARAQLKKLREDTVGWKEKLPRADVAAAIASARALDATFWLLRFFSPAWWRLRGILRARYHFERHVVEPTWTSILEGLAAEYGQEDAIGAVEDEARRALGFDGDLDATAALVERLRDDRGRSARAIELRSRWSRDPASIRPLLQARSAIEALAREADAVLDGGAGWSVTELAERLAEVRSAVDLLPDVQAALRSLLDADPSVREAVRTLPVPATRWDVVVAHASLDRTWRADRALARFDHVALARRQARIRASYQDWLELNAETVLERARSRFEAGLRVCGMQAAALSPSEKELKKSYNAGRRVLEREFEKVVRHRSIRELTQGDTGTVVYDLKPIWLMSPLSISDTIPLDEQRFDVVIFDEASQIPLEEAVPAVYRAPQMIVVGDEQQLPPTSFFASSRDDETDDPDDVRYDLDADSFLSHAARRLPSTMLGWHYRSRSEALIRFSNQSFYGGRLRTIPDRTLQFERPAIRATSDAGDRNAPLVLDRPISFHRVDGAVYAQRRNPEEARYIARLVRGLLSSGLTLGVVAFSEAQQSEIEAALERLAGEDPAFRKALDAEVEREDDGQLVGLFVKNLENVQGDERDVIILSICYGPDASGRMVMNFGPINKGGGEKRLNVVFSRAKRHMAVVSSIDHTAITNHYNDGAACFRRYLQYAEACSRGDDVTAANVMRAIGGAEAAGEGRAASPVATALREALEDRGWEVEEGIGSSGFVVDLAIRDPGAAAFSVGVLVDGPDVHAHPDVFETWHLRPALLTAFGWRVVPVLTKDWLAEPQACVARIEAALRGEPLEVDVETEPEPLEAAPSTPAPAPAPESGPVGPPASLFGKTVVITGALESMSRLEAEAAIRAAGGRVARLAARGVDYAVVGARPGSKLAAARSLGIPVLDEATFRTLLPAAELPPAE